VKKGVTRTRKKNKESPPGLGHRNIDRAEGKQKNPITVWKRPQDTKMLAVSVLRLDVVIRNVCPKKGGRKGGNRTEKVGGEKKSACRWTELRSKMQGRLGRGTSPGGRMGAKNRTPRGLQGSKGTAPNGRQKRQLPMGTSVQTARHTNESDRRGGRTKVVPFVEVEKKQTPCQQENTLAKPVQNPQQRQIKNQSGWMQKTGYSLAKSRKENRRPQAR